MDFSNDSVPPSPEALEPALLSTNNDAFVPGRSHSVCLPVPPATPTSGLSPRLVTSISFSSFADLGIVISPHNLFGDEDEDFVMLDADALDAASPSGGEDINEQSWVHLTPSPALASSSVLPMASPGGDMGPLELPSPSPLRDHLTGLGARVLDWEARFGDVDSTEQAPLLANAAPMGRSSPPIPSFSNRSPSHVSSNRKAPPAPLSLGATSNDWDVCAVAPGLEAFAQQNEALEDAIIYPSREERIATMRNLRDKAWLCAAMMTPLPESGDGDLRETPVMVSGESFEEWVKEQAEVLGELVEECVKEQMEVLGELKKSIRKEMDGLRGNGR